MKTNTFKDILTVAALTGIAYYIARYYHQKKQRDKESREFLHFQLF
ncbi:hypothetical protein [Limibacterium fermenti]|jgi:uncharacterized membrane-anchored protein